MLKCIFCGMDEAVEIYRDGIIARGLHVSYTLLKRDPMWVL